MGKSLFHFDLADTCQGICVLTAEESDLSPFDRAVLAFYGENQRFLDLLYLAILLFISSASGEMEYGTVSNVGSGEFVSRDAGNRQFG